MSIDWLLILLALIGNAAWAASNWWVAIKNEHRAREHTVWLTTQLNELQRLTKVVQEAAEPLRVRSWQDAPDAASPAREVSEQAGCFPPSRGDSAESPIPDLNRFRSR